jgi:hypothetical protein
MEKIKATVVPVKNEHGTEVMVNFLKRLAKKAHHSTRDNVVYQFILKGLTYLQYVDIIQLPVNSKTFLLATLSVEVEGRTYTKEFKLVKILQRENIYELRISYDQSYFRAIFFPLSYNDQTYYCFLFPYFKPVGIPNDPFTNVYRDRAYKIYKEAVINPQKYID